MNGLLLVLSLMTGIGISLLVPEYGASAVLLCSIVALAVGFYFNHLKTDREFLVRLFISGLLCRVLVGTLIFVFELQEFFGGDAFTYDSYGYALAQTWQGANQFRDVASTLAKDFWGITYYVAGIYTLTGRNMLAVQFVNSVLGAATAPLIYLCAQHIFDNRVVSRYSAVLVAFFPSLVLWSAQALKDGLIVFLLVMVILLTFRLSERFSIKYLVILGMALFWLLGLRFYVFYMALVAIAGAFVIGMKAVSTVSLVRQLIILIGLGLALTYMGVLRSANTQFESYGNLEAVQRSRSDLTARASSGFNRDVDVSTTSGALTAVPLGLVYLLFAPFPWQLATVRQSITLPEMLVWWASFPLLITGLWFTLKYRMRQALPILIFTTMLTLAYSIFQGNIGTAYRQRAQVLVFYFIFVSVGAALVKEKREDKQRQATRIRDAAMEASRRGGRADGYLHTAGGDLTKPARRP